MNCNAAAPAPETNISNFPFNEREIKNKPERSIYGWQKNEMKEMTLLVV